MFGVKGLEGWWGPPGAQVRWPICAVCRTLPHSLVPPGVPLQPRRFRGPIAGVQIEGLDASFNVPQSGLTLISDPRQMASTCTSPLIKGALKPRNRTGADQPISPSTPDRQHPLGARASPHLSSHLDRVLPAAVLPASGSEIPGSGDCCVGERIGVEQLGAMPTTEVVPHAVVHAHEPRVLGY